MDSVSALKILQEQVKPVLSTGDCAMLLGMNITSTSKLLSRAAAKNYIYKLKRGLWLINTKLDPLLLPPYLTAPFPSYISLQTALYFHGMISQIPEVIYIVSLARTHRLTTKLGTYSIHHVNPSFYRGFDSYGEHGVVMATPEKALIDFFYLHMVKTKLFAALPELELPNNFDFTLADEYIKSITSNNIRSMVQQRLDNIRK